MKNYLICSILIVPLSMILLINLNYSNSFGIADSSFNVKIINPYKNDTLSNKENIFVKGISTYNSSQDCSVSLIVNNKKPYSLVTPKGNNETGDYTKWEFVIDNNIQKDKLIDNGINKITAKNYCLNPKSSTFYSIFFNRSSTMEMLNQSGVKNTNITSSNATSPVTPSNHSCQPQRMPLPLSLQATPAQRMPLPLSLQATPAQRMPLPLSLQATPAQRMPLPLSLQATPAQRMPLPLSLQATPAQRMPLPLSLQATPAQRMPLPPLPLPLQLAQRMPLPPLPLPLQLAQRMPLPLSLQATPALQRSYKNTML